MARAPLLLFLFLFTMARCAADAPETVASPGETVADALAGDAPPTDLPAPLDAEAGGGEADAVEQRCGSCHGHGDDPVPPPGLDGATLPSAPGVGAHAVHLAASTWHAEVRCRHCHAVPDNVDAPGHLDDDRPADVTLAGLAATNVEAAYGPAGCTTTCHGSALHLDPHPSPPWTGAQAGCTACHAFPPPFPHPSGADCGRCHLDVADATGAIVKAALHVDGALQAPHGAHLFHFWGGAGTILGCDHCHVGTAYHGSLQGGGTLETTTLCDQCHPDDLDRLTWRVDPWATWGRAPRPPDGAR